ncbi:uncharacterized protein cdhr5-rs isoform X2 [Chiloscyllium plagiosum]|uniref:uncharacterized protein cdhr5-rs isoform X2 n=1 Tax=Chiloscyllium plagiosum TaxID=36176 RepID=UPI001CB883E0|nr:uncharacterized protein cdhr5-rs isoform X2 [Chiloscyllium plagiosum]
MDFNTMLKTHTLIVSLLLTRFIPVSMEGNRCSGGHDLYVDIKENSPNGTVIAKLTINGNLSSHEISLNLTGTDMEWFQLEEEVVKLNVLPARQLDRELLSTPLLFATITCTDVATSDQIHYRLMVQVLDENDNPPMFLKESVQQVNISELTQVGNVVFTIKANDRDGDDLIYIIDGATSDAEFFTINLPSSGKVQLAQQLDFEVKNELELMVCAMEVNTKERYNTTAKININVLDGDDQYPRFLPCNFLSHGASRICVNPIYTGNVTEAKLPFHALQLSPGSVLAEDGDIGLQSPVIYSILEGGDNGRFEINNITGALMMRWPVRSYIQNPSFSLTVMASQVDDSSKYTVTKVLIRVLVQNRHRPRFNKIEYKGFVQEQLNPFALVVTYGNKPLLVKAVDQDFKNGRNPKLTYTLTNQSNHTQLYQVTQEGLLLARTNRLHAHEKYMLQIVGTDNESGDMVSTKVNVEVLHSRQPVPSGLPKESRMHSSKEMGLLGGIIAILLLLLIVAFILLVYNLRRRQKQHRQTSTVAVERNTNVINTSKPEQSCRNLAYINEAFSSCNEESNNGGATYNQAKISHELLDAAPIQEQECTIKPILTNGKLTSCKFMCVKADVTAEEISTDAGHQYTECNNEEQRVNSNCPIGVNFQLPGKSGLEERPQWESKKEPLEVIKKTLQEAAGQAETVPEEIKSSVSTEKQDLKAYMTEEQEYLISSTGLADLMTTRGKKQSVSEAIQEHPATTSREQGHIICSKKRASVVEIMAGDAISEDTVRTKNLVALEQPAAEEHPLVETQPVIEVTVEHPVEVLYPASTDHPVKIENTVATMSLASSEYPVVVQHHVETENPVEMEDLGVTRLQVTRKMTTEYPAATEYSVSEDIVFYCPMTGVTIEVLEGAEEMEDTATIKEIVETSAVVTKCPVAEDGIEQVMTEGLAIEGQSITQLDAEDPSAEGSTIKGPEGETPTEGQLEGKGSLSAAGTDLELSEVVSIDSAAKEISLEATRHPEPDMVRDCSVVPMGSTDTDYSAAVERGDSSVTLGENTTNMVMF